MPSTPQEYPFILAGEQRTGQPYEVRCPYDQELIARVHRASTDDLEQAIQAAVGIFSTTRSIPAHRRATALRHIAQSIQAQSEDLARTIALEAGKPIKQARVEVGRSAVTFAAAADEATRSHDEALCLDSAPGGEGRQGLLRRFPIGPIAAISPFNFPLNLVAHKLAPAIAAGCPVVLKPASQTPITAIKLAHIIAESGWPKEALSVLPMNSRDADPLVEDPRFKLLTFTGSPVVGWGMKGRAGKKRVTLELGGNAGVIIHSDANLDFAVTRTTIGGFSYAGQTCISVQRIYVHESLYADYMQRFIASVQKLKLGHPLDEASDLSALISTNEAERIQEWLQEACAAGAKIALGGNIRDGIVEPTILVNAGPQLRVNCQEIFAPVVTVQPYTDFEQALSAINNSDFGLQAGVFTRDIGRIFAAYAVLEVGGLIINDVPTWRVDPMPYGGVKHSGFGREGLKYAIEEMTEPKLLVMNVE